MEKLLEQYDSLGIASFLPDLQPLISYLREQLDNPKGNILKYTEALKKLPDTHALCQILDHDTVTAGSVDDITDEMRGNMRSTLMQLSPWRKGPFELFGIHIDTEWQSNLKWNRFIHHIAPLKNRRILDIGCSNGYYMFRMAGHHPWMILGVEPQHTFYFQYLALQKYLQLKNVFCLPAPFDDLPVMEEYFDTVFCMGVLYHRKSPLDMLKRVRKMMKKGGELVLENLIIESGTKADVKSNIEADMSSTIKADVKAGAEYDESKLDIPLCLFPEDRYAKMRNVFFIPNLKAMEFWLKRTGFGNIKCIDISRTCSNEQRKTEWIQTESLKDFLDPENPSKTVEGYPAPVRGIFTAQAK